jgi:tRNA G18 (ribose-2'-O)-methylase SpoU
MDIQVIQDLEDPRVADYRNVRDAELLRERGLFMAEGRLVVQCLIGHSPLCPRSVFVTPAALQALEPDLEKLDPECPVYTASGEVFSGIVGIRMHRGCLAAGERPDRYTLESVLAAKRGSSGLVVVLEGLTDMDNVGSIFRNCRAFGVDGVLLCPRCCDPLYRKAIRTSLGASLCVPYARCDDWPGSLHRLRDEGYRLVALHPGHAAEDLAHYASRVGWSERTAFIVGTEGPGISPDTLALADVHLRITMASDVDSLNVATAAAIALHHYHHFGRSTRPDSQVDSPPPGLHAAISKAEEVG